MSDKQKKLAEASKTELDPIVELFEIDLSHIIKDGDSVFRYCREKNSKQEPIVYQGNTYNLLPIRIRDIQQKSSGVSNRPKLIVGNVDGLVTGLIVAYEGLNNAMIKRYTVFEKNLDAVNHKDSDISEPDPFAYSVNTYVVNGVDQNDGESVIFELAVPSETDGIVLPARSMLVGCIFNYREAGCGYDGHAVADAKGNALEPHEMDKDACGKTIRDCQIRFCQNGQLNYGGFVSLDRISK